MTVTMTTDYWESVITYEHLHPCPSWETVNGAISRLNEKTYTLVVLDDHRGSNLFIGGGSTGVVVAWSKGESHLIARVGDENEKIAIAVGGQAGEYRRRNVISLGEAQKIAKAYFDGSDVRNLAMWDEQ